MPGNADKQLQVRTVSSLTEIAPDTWDNLANPAGTPHNPFISHAFLTALELSGAAVPETGWYAQHVVLEDARGAIRGVAPCYLKTHSRGEFVFDYGWAEAFERAGGRYYPKLQSSVPFTPVTGARLLVGNASASDDLKRLLGRAMQLVCDRLQASSAHMTFVPRSDSVLLADQSWLVRTDTQFHWGNEDFGSFSDYLASLSSRKRKNVRKERKTALASGVQIECLTGGDLHEHHWDAFFDFYLDTGDRKWGSPYLTRPFFSMVAEAMPERILLVMAKRAGRYIAGALNFIGDDALYGRNWGAIEHHDCLHFELCYYQAIEFAIQNKLKRVEAGAQGEHKLARGYLPCKTYSLHHLADPRFAQAVSDYLEHEKAAVDRDAAYLREHSPFRKPNK